MRKKYFYTGLVHTDDRTALQDTARQLELENVVGDRVFVNKLYVY